MNVARAFRYLALLVVALLLCGCAATSGPTKPPTNADDYLTLQADKSIGQTFVARQGGLHALDVILRPKQEGDGYIRLRLRASATATDDLAVATLPITAVQHTTWYRFDFPTQSDSRQRDYYALFESVGNGRVLVGSTEGSAYNDGAMYRSGVPVDNQLVFRPLYAPLFGIVDAGTQIISWVSTLLIGAFVFLLPGWALLVLLWPGGAQLSWGDKIGLAGGVSLALYPLLLLWTNLVGVQAGALYAYVPGAVALAALAWHHRRWRPAQARVAARAWARSTDVWPDVVLIVLIILVFGVRLAVIEPLDVPLWGDSYQHTMIAQLIFDHGGLFQSWQPYVPYGSLTVQYGFSTAVALWSWLTGVGSAPATLIVGQLINALAVLGLYPLARLVAGGNRWAGVGAVLVGGLFSALPFMYVNWGRYAQLAGQAILPAALWLTCTALMERRALARCALITGATLAGMVLTYYRMPFYYGTFILAWLIAWALPRWRFAGRAWARAGALLALVGGATGALALPWYFFVAGGKLATTVSAGVTGGGAGGDASTNIQPTSQINFILADYKVWLDTTNYVPSILLLLCIVALAWSLYRRQWPIAGMALWVVGLALIVVGRLVRLPGANLMQNFAIIITLYVPISVLVGWLASELAHVFERYAGRLGLAAVTLALGGAAIWASTGQQTIISRDAVIVTRPDLRAMQWIRQNTAANAHFLVEGYLIYGGTSAVGADGGWWIPLLAGRANTMPPQYALLNERPTVPNYTQNIVDLVAKLKNTPLTSPDGLKLLCTNNISHVYIGQSQGTTGLDARPLFSTKTMLDQSVFRQVYTQDRVQIYAFDRHTCGAAQ